MSHKLKLRIRALLFKSRLEHELDEELQFHLEREIEQNLAQGMKPAAARTAALRSFGGVERIKEASRDVRGVRWVEEILLDLQFGWRMLRKQRGFTLAAVLSLGLGIGANTALFSVVDAVLLKTLPVPEPERLLLFEWQAGRDFRTSGMSGTSYVPVSPDLQALSLFRYEVFDRMRQTQAATRDSPLSDLLAFAPTRRLSAVIGNEAEIITGQAVSGSYFSGLRVQPSLGRIIRNEDDLPGAVPVIVLSHQYWQERFGANPAIIGQLLKLNQQPFIVVGVTPPGFAGASQVGSYPAVTVPLIQEPLLEGARSRLGTAGKAGVWWLNLMGRLRPGATSEQARDSLNEAFQAAALEVMPPPRKASDPAKLDPQDYPRLRTESGSRGMLDRRRLFTPTVYGLFMVVGLVLLIACANVANLLLARAALRRAELGVRLAVGAGRFRLMRQLLTESVLLAVLGGSLGVLFAIWGTNTLRALSDTNTGFLPEGVDFGLNWRVLLFTLAVSLLTGVLFGVAPAWRATNLDLATPLKQSSRTVSAVSHLSKGLIIAQVALSLWLLIGAGLFIRTLYNLQRVNLGFNQENLLLFKLQPQQCGYTGDRLIRFYQQLFARLDNLPGVRAATFARIPLIAADNYVSGILLPGEEAMTASPRSTNRQMARENYFATMGIPLLSGREFTAQDNERAPEVAIVNQSFAQKFFPETDVLGQRVTFQNSNRVMEIIGVVADTKYMSQREELKPLLYTPWLQERDLIGEMTFALRTTSEPTALAATVRQVVRELDHNLPVTEIGTQTDRAHATLGRESLSARLLSFFGLLALLLATIGLSGVLAYAVTQRTSEIGIHLALGAQTHDVLRLVVWQGMKLILVGLVVGALGGYALKHLFKSGYLGLVEWQHQFGEQLYGVSAADPWTFAVIAAFLTCVALLACYFPARRAAKVDPMIVLRSE